MKTKPARAKKAEKKLPKGRVQRFHFNTERYPYGGDDLPCAVIPCNTAAEARRIVKLHRMTHTERFFAIKKAMGRPPHIRTLSILAALHLAEEPKSFL